MKRKIPTAGTMLRRRERRRRKERITGDPGGQHIHPQVILLRIREIAQTVARYSPPTGIRPLAWQSHAGGHVCAWVVNMSLQRVGRRWRNCVSGCARILLKTNASGRGECCGCEGEADDGFRRLLRTGVVT